MKSVSLLLLSLFFYVAVMGQQAPEISETNEKIPLGKISCNEMPATPEQKEIKLNVTYNRNTREIKFVDEVYFCKERSNTLGYMESLIVVDGSGKEVKINHSIAPRTRVITFYPISIDKFAGDKLIIRSVNYLERDCGYRTINLNREVIAFKAWKVEANLKKAINGSLQEEIQYLKTCPYSDHRAILENDVVNNKVKEIKDVVYVNDNYPALKDRLVDKMLVMISNVTDCKTFLKYYNTETVKAENVLYNLLKNTTSQSDLNSYIEMFPNGGHITEIRSQKTELQYYNKASEGEISDCATYIAKYPNGRFVSEVQSRKQRLEQLRANSNKSLWKMGNKICHCNTYGITMVTLDQWNEDKSNFKGIVVASPGGLYEGTILQKGNVLWIEPVNWHKCLEDEVEYALVKDRSAEAEKLMKEKNMKFPRGTVVSQSFETGWLFKFTNTITAKVEDWNDDFTKMKIQIVKTGGLDYFNGESIYEGKYIWVSPIGWKRG